MRPPRGCMTASTRLFAPLLCVFALGLTNSPPAQAGSRKRVEIQFQNNAHDQSMRCSLSQVWGPASRPKTKTIARYTIRGKSHRPESQRHLPIVKHKWISPVVRRLSGENVYPKLQLTCALDDNIHARNEATSQLWDHASKSFDDHHLWAGCTNGAPCGVVIER